MNTQARLETKIKEFQNLLKEYKEEKTKGDKIVVYIIKEQLKTLSNIMHELSDMLEE
jgi:hypothetical protein|nr:MAG TPA: hypothetical protein [Caudoviricetes sp.]